MLKNKNTNEVIKTSRADYNVIYNYWQIDGGITIQDPDKEWEFVQDPPTVGPVKFKMLFTSEERQKAKTLRATDTTLDDFWELLDDCIATNTSVDMSLESVQNAILYTLTKVEAAGVDLDVATRNAEILTGNPK